MHTIKIDQLIKTTLLSYTIKGFGFWTPYKRSPCDIADNYYQHAILEPLLARFCLFITSVMLSNNT
jgi:hypothetical protein